MTVLAIDHITINVDDLKKTEEFYSKILGLEKNGFVNMGDHTLTYFRLTDETRLELIQYLTPGICADVSETDRRIYRHFCIQTDDLDAFDRTCRANNVKIRKGPSYVEKLKCRTMLIIDPNNVEIEIIQK